MRYFGKIHRPCALIVLGVSIGSMHLEAQATGSASADFFGQQVPPGFLVTDLMWQNLQPAAPDGFYLKVDESNNLIATPSGSNTYSLVVSNKSTKWNQILVDAEILSGNYAQPNSVVSFGSNNTPGGDVWNGAPVSATFTSMNQILNFAIASDFYSTPRQVPGTEGLDPSITEGYQYSTALGGLPVIFSL